SSRLTHLEAILEHQHTATADADRIIADIRRLVSAVHVRGRIELLAAIRAGIAIDKERASPHRLSSLTSILTTLSTARRRMFIAMLVASCLLRPIHFTSLPKSMTMMCSPLLAIVSPMTMLSSPSSSGRIFMLHPQYLAHCRRMSGLG